MSQVYSTRFIGIIDVAAETSYVVPEGFRAIVRDIDAFLDGSPDDSGASLGVVENGTILWDVQFTEAFQNAPWRGRQVVEQGETIRLVIGGSTNISVAVSGYLLTLP